MRTINCPGPIPIGGLQRPCAAQLPMPDKGAEERTCAECGVTVIVFYRPLITRPPGPNIILPQRKPKAPSRPPVLPARGKGRALAHPPQGPSLFDTPAPVAAIKPNSPKDDPLCRMPLVPSTRS